jgi:hypothetical protein
LRTRSALGLLAAAALAAGACASNPLPRDRHVSAEEAITSGKGAYAAVDLANGGQVMGELIAVATAPPALWILTDLDKLEAVPLPSVRHMRLGVHESNENAYTAWVVLGSLSTLSHGFWLIFSLPTWLIAGSAATVAESYRGLLDCDAVTAEEPASRERTSSSWEYPSSSSPKQRPAPPCGDALPAYARFPQGLPPGVGADHLLGRAKFSPPTPTPEPATKTPEPATTREPATPTPEPYDSPLP